MSPFPIPPFYDAIRRLAGQAKRRLRPAGPCEETPAAATTGAADRPGSEEPRPKGPAPEGDPP